MQVVNELLNQRKIAFKFIIFGIILFTITIIIGGLLEPISGGSASNSSRGDNIGFLWPFFVTLLAPYGLYRLIRLNHYATKSLRQKLIASHEEIQLYDAKIKADKELIRKNKWYNHEILSIKTEQSLGIWFVKSVVAMSLIVILSVIALALTK